jgi:GR25 family glycosyltransferase involved in LPS biosynthesis
MEWKNILITVTVVVLAVILWVSRPKLTKNCNLTKPKIQAYVYNPITKKIILSTLCNKRTASCGFPECSHACCNSNMLEMLIFVSGLLDKNKIPNWITCGTLLGWKRHKGFIPWDDDTDIFSTATKDQIELLRPLIEHEDYVLTYSSGVGKEGKTPPYAYYCIQYSKTNNTHLDIGLVTPITVGNEQYLFDGPKSFEVTDVQKFKTWLSPVKYVFPLRKSTFYGHDINIPSKPDELLKFWYGNDCLEVAKIKKGELPGIPQNLQVDTTITKFEPGVILKTQSILQKPNEEYGIYKCFIINLDWQHDRLHHSIEECDKIGIWAERIDAVKGRDMNKFTHLCKESTYKMKKNEIGCYLSHVKAIQQVADCPDGSNCLIVEDDISFRDNFTSIMRMVKQYTKQIDWDVIFLGSSPYDVNQLEEILPNLYITGLSTGTWAYMINPVSARYILSKIFPIMYPIDLVLTVPDSKFDTSRVYDTRFYGNLKKFSIHDGSVFKTDRIGIVDEISTEFRISTSSENFVFLE